MPRGLIKIKDKYFEWSTITDSPVTNGMTKEELKKYTNEVYGKQGLMDFEERIERTKKTGTSYHGESLDSLISINRAGKNEETLTKDEIYEIY